MSKDCGHSVPCGCGDQSLVTPPPCNTSGNCAGEPCPEFFDWQCLVYTGPELRKEISGVDFIINNGDRLNTVLQKMLQAFSGDPLDITDAAFGLRFANITSTGFSLSWEGNPALQYRIHTNLLDPLTLSFEEPVIGVFTYEFTGLVSGGEYEIYIEDVDNGQLSSKFYLTLP